jgi:ankyrin repeat protein
LLVVAVERKSDPLAQLLLDKGANPNALDWRSGPLLYRAIQYLDYRLTRLLPSKGADVNKANVGETRPLGGDVIGGDHGLTRLLSENGADIDIPVTGHGENVPLRLACRCHQGKVMEFLMASGAKKCITDAEELYLRRYIK